jgi:hypothetical protein
MELTVDATRAAVSGAPELAAAQQALDANSREIGEAFASVFGATEAARLAALWGDHVDAVVAFAVATRDKDDAGQQKARADLERFAAALGTGLRTLARGKVEAAAATKALDQHDAHLLEAITAYASGDYRRAHDVSYAGFQHMFPIAATLARAVEGHVGARLPVGGAATGHGGTAQRRR